MTQKTTMQRIIAKLGSSEPVDSWWFLGSLAAAAAGLIIARAWGWIQ